MNDMNSHKFKIALSESDLESLKVIPKSDLHNHFVLGGCREFLFKSTGKFIQPTPEILTSMEQMHRWHSINMGNLFSCIEMRKLLIDATFVQANQDGIRILEIGEDVWGLNEYFDNDIDILINAFKESNTRYAPDTELRLQIGLSRHCSIEYLERAIEPFWGRKEFYSIDLYGDEFSQPIENFKNIYKKAKNNGLKLKAHVGEWGTAEDVCKAIELLELDEVQHGIAAASNDYSMQLLKERGIRLNITPTSNIKLGRVESMRSHPIKKLLENEIDITINSDDILIFDSVVSNEYLQLYEHQVLNADELDQIRLNGLKRI